MRSARNLTFSYVFVHVEVFNLMMRFLQVCVMLQIKFYNNKINQQQQQKRNMLTF